MVLLFGVSFLVVSNHNMIINHILIQEFESCIDIPKRLLIRVQGRPFALPPAIFSKSILISLAFPAGHNLR